MKAKIIFAHAHKCWYVNTGFPFKIKIHFAFRHIQKRWEIVKMTKSDCSYYYFYVDGKITGLDGKAQL